MKRPNGFTLLELVIALTLAGVVALLVYGAARAGADAEQRIAQRRKETQAARAMHVLIADALRNAQRANLPGEQVFALDHRVDDAGRPKDRLAFISAGGIAPLGAGADWQLTLQAGPEGLDLIGRPIGIRGEPRLLGRLPGITALAIRVLGAGSWTSAWQAAAPPSVVELTYWADTGPLGSPWRIAVPLGAWGGPR